MLTGFKDWLKQPFESNMDAWHWFLFIGLLIVITAVWHMILDHVVS